MRGIHTFIGKPLRIYRQCMKIRTTVYCPRNSVLSVLIRSFLISLRNKIGMFYSLIHDQLPPIYSVVSSMETSSLKFVIAIKHRTQNTSRIKCLMWVVKSLDSSVVKFLYNLPTYCCIKTLFNWNPSSYTGRRYLKTEFSNGRFRVVTIKYLFVFISSE